MKPSPPPWVCPLWSCLITRVHSCQSSMDRCRSSTVQGKRSYHQLCSRHCCWRWGSSGGRKIATVCPYTAPVHTALWAPSKVWRTWLLQWGMEDGGGEGERAQAESQGPCLSAWPPSLLSHLGAWGQAATPLGPSARFSGCQEQALGHCSVFFQVWSEDDFSERSGRTY